MANKMANTWKVCHFDRTRVLLLLPFQVRITRSRNSPAWNPKANVLTRSALIQGNSVRLSACRSEKKRRGTKVSPCRATRSNLTPKYERSERGLTNSLLVNGTSISPIVDRRAWGCGRKPHAAFASSGIASVGSPSPSTNLLSSLVDTRRGCRLRKMSSFPVSFPPSPS